MYLPLGDEVRGAHGIEGRIGLCGHRLGEERLARPRRTVQQNTLPLMMKYN